MYTNKTIGIKSNNRNIPKYSNLQRPRVNINTGKKLVTNANKNNIRKELAEQDNEKLKHTEGRQSYAEKAIKLGVYDEIADFLFYLREENPFLTQKNIRDALVENFPDVFGSCSKYPQNLMKVIDAEEAWKNALNFNMNEVKNAVLQQLYIRAVKGVKEYTDKDGKIYEVGMKDSDRIRYVQLLNELEQNNVNVEEEDIPNFKWGGVD